MISLLISELVQMTSIWSLNKANEAPDTWNFYQCVHITWLRYELSRGEESPEGNGTSQAWSAAHKSILTGQGHRRGPRTPIGKEQGWEGFYMWCFSRLLISWRLMERWRTSAYCELRQAALNSMENYTLKKVKKTTPKLHHQHLPHPTLLSPFNLTQDLLICSHKKREQMSIRVLILLN